MRALAVLLIITVVSQAVGQDRIGRILAQLQRSAGDPIALRKFRELDRESIPRLIRAMHFIESGRVLALVAEKLRGFGATQSIPALAEELNRDLIDPQRQGHAAYWELDEWGWQADAEMIRLVRSGTYRQRLFAGRVLARRSEYRPTDARVVQAMIQLSRSPSAEHRGVALLGLWHLSGRLITWSMDGITKPMGEATHEPFEALLRLVFDEDIDVRERAAHHVWVYLWSNDRSLPNPPDGRADPLSISKLDRQLLQMGRTASPAMRAGAITLVAASGMKGHQVPALSDPHAIVRRAALTSIGARAPATWASELVLQWRNPHPGIRRTIAEALGLTYSESALPALRALLNDKEPSVRAVARRSIDKIEGMALRAND